MAIERFNQLPFRTRWFGMSSIALLVATLAAAVDLRALIPIAVLCCIALLLIVNSFQVDLDSGDWRIEKGMFPFVSRRVGSHDEIYGIEINVGRRTRDISYTNSRDNSDTDMYVASYGSVLFFKDDSLKPIPLYGGRSFPDVAEPVADFAHRIRVPVMLSNDLLDRQHDLERYQAEAKFYDQDQGAQ